jgi:hypothetical protein
LKGVTLDVINLGWTDSSAPLKIFSLARWRRQRTYEAVFSPEDKASQDRATPLVVQSFF